MKVINSSLLSLVSGSGGRNDSPAQDGRNSSSNRGHDSGRDVAIAAAAAAGGVIGALATGPGRL